MSCKQPDSVSDLFIYKWMNYKPLKHVNNDQVCKQCSGDSCIGFGIELYDTPFMFDNSYIKMYVL